MVTLVYQKFTPQQVRICDGKGKISNQRRTVSDTWKRWNVRQSSILKKEIASTQSLMSGNSMHAFHSHALRKACRGMHIRTDTGELPRQFIGLSVTLNRIKISLSILFCFFGIITWSLSKGSNLLLTHIAGSPSVESLEDESRVDLTPFLFRNERSFRKADRFQSSIGAFSFFRTCTKSLEDPSILKR